MVDLPDVTRIRGPVPGPVHITLKAQADMVAGSVVTFGTEDRSIALCGASDFPLGWIQDLTVQDKITTVDLFSPMWRGNVAATSAAISFGDTLTTAADGEITRATSGTGQFKAMSDAVAGGQVLYISCVANPAYTTS